jgi:hypothetical protein
LDSGDNGGVTGGHIEHLVAIRDAVNHALQLIGRHPAARKLSVVDSAIIVERMGRVPDPVIERYLYLHEATVVSSQISAALERDRDERKVEWLGDEGGVYSCSLCQTARVSWRNRS